MYQFFCEYPVGDKVCSSRSMGRCYSCGRLICRLHGKIEENRLYCFDCEPVFPEQKKEVKEEFYQPEYTEKVELSSETEAGLEENGLGLDQPPESLREKPTLWDF